MFLEAITTAIIVSIDGFFSGVAIGLKNQRIKFDKLLLISIIPIIMAIPIMVIGNCVSSFIESEMCNYIGFILFLFLSFNSYIQIKNNNNPLNINFTSSIIIGISVGIDSSISAFSLSLNHHNPFITPLYFGIMHFILIFIGNFISFKINKKNIFILKYLSPILFIIIAIFKII